jgi:hypothetical protein
MKTNDLQPSKGYLLKNVNNEVMTALFEKNPSWVVVKQCGGFHFYPTDDLAFGEVNNEA